MGYESCVLHAEFDLPDPAATGVERGGKHSLLKGRKERTRNAQGERKQESCDLARLAEEPMRMDERRRSAAGVN